MAVSYATIVSELKDPRNEELEKKDKELNEFRKREIVLNLQVENLFNENKSQRTTILQLNKQIKASPASRIDELTREAKAEMREIVAVKGEMIAVKAEMAAVKESAKEHTAELAKMRESVMAFMAKILGSV